MGWGTCYIDPDGYLSRIAVERIEDEIENAECRVKNAFGLMSAIMASSPADVMNGDGEEPMPWPEYVKEQGDIIEDTVREGLSDLRSLYAAQRALEKKTVEIEYCGKGHGQVKGEWCDEGRCHICHSPIVGSCKLRLVEKDY